MNWENKSMFTPMTLDKTIEQYNATKQRLNTEKWNQMTSQRFANMENNLSVSINSNNEKIKKQGNIASRTWLVAQMISEEAAKHWKDYSTMTDWEILNTYKSKNPNRASVIDAFINSEQDPYELKKRMGWTSTPVVEVSNEPEKTFMDKAKKSIVWPFARALWALWEWAYWAFKWLANAPERFDEFNQWQIDRGYIDKVWTDWESLDTTLYQKIKFFPRLIATLWQVVWDVAWWAIMWAADWFTTNQEQAAVKDAVAEVASAVINSEPWQKVQEMYNSLSDEQKQELWDRFTILDWISDIPLSIVWGKAIKTAGKQWIKALDNAVVEQWVKQLDNVIEWVNTAAKNYQVNKAINNLDKNRAAAEEQVRDITQLASGTKDIKDINRLKKEWRSALSQVDTKWVKTYKDLGWRINNKQTEIAKQVDEVLSKDNTKYSWVWTKEVDLPDWKKTPNVIKPIETGLNDLEKLYTKIWDDEWIAIVNFWKNKLATEWLTKKEMNDISRMYGNEFSSKAFKEDWTLKFSDVWEWFANNRDNMKEYVRSLMPDDTTKQLDRTYHELADTKFLVNRMASKVESIQQKIRDKSLFQKIWWGLWDLIDILSWGSIKALLGKLIKWWTEFMDAADLEKQLPKMLSKLDDLNRKIDLANTDEEVQEVAKIINSFK